MTLLLPLLIPILGAALILWLGTNEVRAKGWSLFVGAAEIVAVVNLIWDVYHSGPASFGRYLRADALSALFLLNFVFITGLALVYSLGYLRHVGGERFS